MYPPSAPLTDAPLLVNMPLAAVAVSLKVVSPPAPPLTVPGLLMKVAAPALEELLKVVLPCVMAAAD